MFLKREKIPLQKYLTTKSGFDLSQKRTRSPQISRKIASRTTKVKWTLQNVRPIQMDELLRKDVSRRRLALNEGEIAALTAAVRQLGVGSQGGAEALAIFHQLIFDESVSRSLDTPPARIKVDEQNCFGLVERNTVRISASSLLPKHATVAGWKHRRCPKTVAQSKETLTAP